MNGEYVATVQKKYYTRSYVRNFLGQCLYVMSCSSCREEELIQKSESKKYESVSGGDGTTTTQMDVLETSARWAGGVYDVGEFLPYHTEMNVWKYRQKVHELLKRCGRGGVTTPLDINLLLGIGVTVRELIRACITVDELKDNHVINTFDQLCALGLRPMHMTEAYASRYFSLERVVSVFEVTFDELHAKLKFTVGDLVLYEGIDCDLLVAMQFSVSTVERYVKSAQERRFIYDTIGVKAQLTALDWEKKFGATEKWRHRREIKNE